MALFNWPWKNPQAPSNQQQLDYQEDIFNFSNKKTTPMDLVSKKSIQNFIVKAVGFVTAQTQRNIDGFLQLAQMPAEQCDKFFIGKLSIKESSSSVGSLPVENDMSTITFFSCLILSAI